MCYIVTPWRGFGSGLGSALLLFWQIPRPPDCPSQTGSAALQPPAAKSRLRSGALIHGHVARIGGPTEPTPAHRDAPERTGPVQAWWSHHLRPTDGDYHEPGEDPATCGSGRATLRRAHDRCDLRRRGSCYRPRRAGQSPAYPLKTGITRTREFERKRLATHAVNVGTKCGHGCTYCSTRSDAPHASARSNPSWTRVPSTDGLRHH